MKTIPHVFVLALSCLLMNGCEQNTKNTESNNSRSPVDTAIEFRIRDAESSIAMTVDNITDLYSRVGKLEKTNAEVSTERDEFGWAITDFGRFPVRCSSITPILDGYKIHLMIGNMTTAILSGAAVTVYPAPPRPEQQTGESGMQFQKRLHDWYMSPAHPVEVKVPTSFRPATWTGIDVVITPAIPNDVKRIFVGVEFTSINLTSQ